MTTIRKKIEEKYGNVNRFAIEIGWSYQRAFYVATKDPNEMNLKKLNVLCDILECGIDELI